MKKPIDYLRQTTIFASLPEETLAQLADSVSYTTAKAGELVFEKGSSGTSMYIIARGRVRAHDGDLFLNNLEVGEVFGEMAALDPEVRSASVTALVDTDLYCLEHQILADITATQPAVGQAVIRVLCRHIRDRVTDLSQKHEYLRQFNRVIEAAHAVENGTYDTELLTTVTERTDELGQLARVFQQMAKEIHARERELKSSLMALRIEIDRTLQKEQLNRIESSDYFKKLRGQANDLRKMLEE